MEVKSKYNVGDKIYVFAKNNEPSKEEIESIHISITRELSRKNLLSKIKEYNDVINISYKIISADEFIHPHDRSNQSYFDEDEVFETKEEVAAHFKDMIEYLD